MRRRLVILLTGLLVVAGSPLVLAAPAVAPAAEAKTWGSDPLDEVYAAASAVDRCGLSKDAFVAAMLAPSWPETGAPDTLAPSPMTLSRWDNQSALYAFGDAGTPYRRAFWHPGVGLWQFDSAGLGAPYTASQRADIRVMATAMASTISARYCSARNDGKTVGESLAFAWTPWHGCGSGRCATIFVTIYEAGTGLRNVVRDRTVSNTGGVVQRTCRGPGASGSFACWRVDPAKAEGYGAGSIAWADPAYGGSATAPLTAPFYTYAAGGYEYRHWLRADTGYSSGVWARRQLGQNARTSLQWSGGESLCDVTTGAGACCPNLPVPHDCAPASVSGVYTPVAGDFNADGIDDVLWYGPGGAPDRLWQGTIFGRFVGRSITVTGDYTPVAGDFDGNGTDDILWYKPGGQRDDRLWRGKRNGNFVGFTVNVTGTFRPVAADFNADSRDDVFWYGDGARADYVWYGTRTGFVNKAFDQPGSGLVPMAANFDGDERADVFFHGPGEVQDSVWYGTVGRVFSVQTDTQIGGTSYLPVAGRLNRGRRADVLWYAPGTVSDVLYLGAPGRAFTGLGADIDETFVPFVGDFNGNGVEDVFWYGPGGARDALTLTG